ncbi:MAG: hypothetical protein HND57_11935 [Planctomycetes bacterium]|nr:hypothetical protein [Planctomycetota bacterium]
MRIRTKLSLKYPPVRLTHKQRLAVAGGFGQYFRERGLRAWACAIVPDHIHLVLESGSYDPKRLVVQLKGGATRALKQQGIHPLKQYADEHGTVPKCFAKGQWVVYLDPDDVGPAIRYVNNNPVKEGLPSQVWPFIAETMTSRSAPPRG